MHHGRNSDHANEVMRFPGLEMFIYGERVKTARLIYWMSIEVKKNQGFQQYAYRV